MDCAILLFNSVIKFNCNKHSIVWCIEAQCQQLIIFNVSNKGSLFTHWQFLTAGDRKTAFLQAGLVSAPAVSDPGVLHVTLVLLFSGLPTQPHFARPQECCLKWSHDFPMNKGASLGTHSEAADRESPEPLWLTPLCRFHHMQTLTQTHKQYIHITYTNTHACVAHTPFGQVNHDIWGTLKSNLSCLENAKCERPCFLHNGLLCCVTVFESPCWTMMRMAMLVLAFEARRCAMQKPLGQDIPHFSPEWDTRAREIGARAAGAQWGCQSVKWGVNSGPTGSHMSSFRKQQCEE